MAAALQIWSPTFFLQTKLSIRLRVGDTTNRGYLRNAYRVLLTRARQRTVFFVPPGSSNDRTRDPGFYDSTFNYLRELGIAAVEEKS